MEPQERYWAREVAWIAKQIINNGESLNFTKLRCVTNARRENLIACISYLDEFADEELKEQIITAIKGEERWKD